MNSLMAVCYAHGRPTRSAECYALINGATHLLRKFRLTAQQLRFGQVVVTFALLPLTRRCKLTTPDNSKKDVDFYYILRQSVFNLLIEGKNDDFTCSIALFFNY